MNIATLLLFVCLAGDLTPPTDWGKDILPLDALVPCPDQSDPSMPLALILRGVDVPETGDGVHLRLVNRTGNKIRVLGFEIAQPDVTLEDLADGRRQPGKPWLNARTPRSALVVPPDCALAITTDARPDRPCRFGLTVRRDGTETAEMTWSARYDAAPRFPPLNAPIPDGKPRLVPVRWTDRDCVLLRFDNPLDEVVTLHGPSGNHTIYARPQNRGRASNACPPQQVDVPNRSSYHFTVWFSDAADEIQVRIGSAAHGSFATEWFPRPALDESAVQGDEPFISFDRLAPDFENGSRVWLRLENPTDQELTFLGLSLTRPRVEIETNGKLEPRSGVFAQPNWKQAITLGPHRAIRFKTDVRADAPYRVAITLLENGQERRLESDWFPSPWGQER